MASAIDSIVNFLTARKDRHNGPDLVARALRHGRDLEYQVNVSGEGGIRVEGKHSVFTCPDGLKKWFSYRIPRDANSNPNFTDYELGFPLDLHTDGIGTTWFDWRNKRSRGVGFDFDSIVGHSKSVGVDKDRLIEIQNAATAIPYVEVRKSSGGQGLHLFVWFDEDGIPCENHTEHAALARCVLGIISRDAGFDFKSDLDTCGGIMWLYHRKSTPENEGFKLLKAAECAFPTDQIPANWKEHVAVIKRQRARVRVTGVPDSEEDVFEMLASAHRRVPLDDTHRAVMDELGKLNCTVTWDADRHMLVTHTKVFDMLINGEARERLGLAGVYSTSSPGSDLGTPNCFAFPSNNGSWRLYRFGQGVSEAATWEQDGQGWTTCWWNSAPNLPTAARGMGGRELANGGFEFDSLEAAVAAVKVLNPNANIEYEDQFADRVAVVKKTKDGKLAFQIDKRRDDPDRVGNWSNSDRKNSWTQVVQVAAQPVQIEVADYDSVIRCLESPDNKPAGWAIQKEDKTWTLKNSSSVKMVLQQFGHAKPEAEQLMGLAERRPWMRVALPFQPEYPGNRQWNLHAPQLRFDPSPRDAGEPSHPHWDMVVEHIGTDLTPHLKTLDWAKEAGILTGGDYLKAWYACVIRHPFEPLPYLFFFGPQNSGKSIFWEAFHCLVTKGVVEAHRALSGKSDFNGELEGTVLVAIEEQDLSNDPRTMAKIKLAVTAIFLAIRRMRQDAYMVLNTNHFVHCANSKTSVPIFKGDERVTMCHVPSLTRDIPKRVLRQKLEEEAPAFLRTLIDMTLPPSTGRLRIPIVNTGHKKHVEQMNQTALEIFFEEKLSPSTDTLIPFADFYESFIHWVDPDEIARWTKQRVSKELPMGYRTERKTGNKTFLVGAKWNDE